MAHRSVLSTKRPSRNSGAKTVGQEVEWLVWEELAFQSKGGLHVYLPLLDRGVDALIHRHRDGAFIPIQVKGRSHLTNGELVLDVASESLADSRVIIAAVYLSGDRLGDRALVVDVGTFKRLADLRSEAGRDVYAAEVPFAAGARSRWAPYVVPLSDLVSRLGYTERAAFSAKPTTPSLDRFGLGFLGEAEAIRRLAESQDLILYRPFPDLDSVEIAAQHRESRAVVGLQVKTVTVDSARSRPGAATVRVHASTWIVSPTTYLLVLAWHESQRRFDDECLLVPSSEVERITTRAGKWMQILYHPGSPKRGRLDPFRKRLADLPRLVEHAARPHAL